MNAFFHILSICLECVHSRFGRKALKSNGLVPIITSHVTNNIRASSVDEPVKHVTHYLVLVNIFFPSIHRHELLPAEKSDRIVSIDISVYGYSRHIAEERPAPNALL